jgi:hypothetical protein
MMDMDIEKVETIDCEPAPEKNNEMSLAITNDDITSTKEKIDLLVGNASNQKDYSAVEHVIESFELDLHVIRLPVTPDSTDAQTDDDHDDHEEGGEEEETNTKKRQRKSKSGLKLESYTVCDDAYEAPKPTWCFKLTPEHLAALREGDKADEETQELLLSMVKNPNFQKASTVLKTENTSQLFLRACVTVHTTKEELEDAKKDDVKAFNDTVYLLAAPKFFIEAINDDEDHVLNYCTSDSLSSAEVKTAANAEAVNDEVRKKSEEKKKRKEEKKRAEAKERGEKPPKAEKKSAPVFDPSGKSFVFAKGKLSSAGSGRNTLATKEPKGKEKVELDAKKRDARIMEAFQSMETEKEDLAKRAKVVHTVHPIRGSDACMIVLNGTISQQIDVIDGKSTIIFKPNEELDGVAIA